MSAQHTAVSRTARPGRRRLSSRTTPSGSNVRRSSTSGSLGGVGVVVMAWLRSARLFRAGFGPDHEATATAASSTRNGSIDARYRMFPERTARFSHTRTGKSHSAFGARGPPP